MDIDVYNSESKTIKSFSCPLIENSRYEETYNDNVCRICETNNIQLTPIFKDDGLKNQFEIKINKYLPLKVSENDNLPKSICSLCISTLNSWHDLFETCKKTDKRLKKLRYIQQIQLKQQKNLIDKMHSYGTKILEENPSTSASLQENRITEQSFQQNLDHLSDNCANDVDNYENLIECRDENVDNPIGLTEEESNVSSSVPRPVTQVILPYSCDAESANKPPVQSKQLLKCEHCEKEFASDKSLTIHLHSHIGECRFMCHICGKQFASKYHFKYHMQDMHEGLKSFVCDRPLADKRSLADQRPTHTGEKSYACPICHKAFKSLSSMFAHKKTHSVPFDYACTLCQKKFHTQDCLQLHIMTHIKEKNHVCEICGLEFRLKCELARHLNVHSSVKPYACNICGLSFAQKRYLKSHTSNRHPGHKQIQSSPYILHLID